MLIGKEYEYLTTTITNMNANLTFTEKRTQLLHQEELPEGHSLLRYSPHLLIGLVCLLFNLWHQVFSLSLLLPQPQLDHQSFVWVFHFIGKWLVQRSKKSRHYLNWVKGT
jgi:hypothetical protein